jgi:hypothetical protein
LILRVIAIASAKANKFAFIAGINRCIIILVPAGACIIIPAPIVRAGKGEYCSRKSRRKKKMPSFHATPPLFCVFSASFFPLLPSLESFRRLFGLILLIFMAFASYIGMKIGVFQSVLKGFFGLILGFQSILRGCNVY